MLVHSPESDTEELQHTHAQQLEAYYHQLHAQLHSPLLEEACDEMVNGCVSDMVRELVNSCIDDIVRRSARHF